MIFIGTAGWSIPKSNADDVPAGPTSLARYASVFNCCEINSTFTRVHRASTLARWADAVPDGFRFSVKMPKAITHERRLVDCAPEIGMFLASIALLGDKLGPLLVQLPPSLEFDGQVATEFFQLVRSQTQTPIICEPRHPTWFADEANEALAGLEIARAAADPSVVPEANMPGGYGGLTYVRLHGSPRIYYSPYQSAELEKVGTDLRRAKTDAWCIFDNTASGAAFNDALRLARIIGHRTGASSN